jgi:hypothetical protein
VSALALVSVLVSALALVSVLVSALALVSVLVLAQQQEALVEQGQVLALLE